MKLLHFGRIFSSWDDPSIRTVLDKFWFNHLALVIY